MRIVFSKLLLDINTGIIREKLYAKDTDINDSLKSKKRQLKQCEKNIRENIQTHIKSSDTIDMDNLKKEIENLILSKENIENEIASIGEEKYRLTFCQNNIQTFKNNLFKITDENINYFNEHFEELNSLLPKFIKKAVLSDKLSNGKFSIEIEYTK